MSFSQPIKGGDSGEHQADYEVADGKHCRSHVGKSHLVDVSFEDGGGKTAEDIKDEQDGKAGVRKVESQGDISADYKNEDQDSHLTRTEVVVHPVGPESGEADRQIQYRPNNAIPGNGSFQIH